MGIYNELVFTEAVELVEKIMHSDNADEIGNLIERLSTSSDLAMASMMLFVMKAKGVDTTTKTGVELANAKPTIADLLLPPGVKLH